MGKGGAAREAKGRAPAVPEAAVQPAKYAFRPETNLCAAFDDTIPDAFPGNIFRVESVWETVERRLYMGESLAILDQRTRELFFRRYILDETVEEAAKALGMKNSAAKSRLKRGRSKLKQSRNIRMD